MSGDSLRNRHTSRVFARRQTRTTRTRWQRCEILDELNSFKSRDVADFMAGGEEEDIMDTENEDAVVDVDALWSEGWLEVAGAKEQGGAVAVSFALQVKLKPLTHLHLPLILSFVLIALQMCPMRIRRLFVVRRAASSRSAVVEAITTSFSRDHW
jgi:hypothetical protein